jgi:hypothetical protein
MDFFPPLNHNTDLQTPLLPAFPISERLLFQQILRLSLFVHPYVFVSPQSESIDLFSDSITLPDHGTNFKLLELLIWIFNPEQALSTMLHYFEYPASSAARCAAARLT